MEINLIYTLIFLISIVQSIAGVGILVLGTPIMLLLNYQVLDAMFFLLPISILSSFTNLVILKSLYKNKDKLDFKLFKYFFFFCFPAICLGLVIAKKFSLSINFNILVSFIIFLSIFIKLRYQKITLFQKKLKKMFTLIIGIVHGLTNSGGTLLTLFMLNKKKSLISTRFEIHLFYLLLAFTQYSFLKLIVKTEMNFQIDFLIIGIQAILGSLIGNLFANRIQNITTNFIYTLAVLSASILFINGIL
jgi:uncharacterized membrane protein YfcA